MSSDIIRFANVIVGNHEQIMVAVRDACLDPELTIEIILKLGNGFEIFQGIDLIGQIDNTPDDVMQALALARRVVLVEVAEDGPSRIHENVVVRHS